MSARLLGTLILPGLAEAVPLVRRHARDLLGDGPDVDDLALLVSEVLTNAIRHTRSGMAGGTVTLNFLDAGPVTRVEVIDAGGAPTRAKPRDDVPEDSESGHGLHLVAALAKRWASIPVREGTKTWFEI